MVASVRAIQGRKIVDDFEFVARMRALGDTGSSNGPEEEQHAQEAA